MNKTFLQKLIYHVRYGAISPIWPWVSRTLIKLGGAKIAAYLSYYSIDWGEMKYEQSILCLHRESFVKDVIELRKRTKFNYPMVMGGYTRFQMVWMPKEMQVQTFYQKYQKNEEEAVSLSTEYALHLLKLISKRKPIDAILSANFDYWQDLGFKRACKKLNIPFFVLSREHPVIPKVCEEVIKWYKEANYSFDGTAIAVAGASTKDVILKVGSICNPEQVTITGLPRYDAWRNVDRSVAIDTRKYITLLSFSLGYYADETFKQVLDLFCGAAAENFDNETTFFVKTKDAEDTQYVRSLLTEVQLENIQCDHHIALFELLPQSRLVINYNSLSLVEAVMARSTIVIPAWGECKDQGEEAMYSSDNPNITKVVQFAYTPEQFLSFISLSISSQNSLTADEDISDFLGEYIHITAQGTYCEAFEVFLISNMAGQ